MPAPRHFDPLQPIFSFYHMQAYLHLVALYASIFLPADTMPFIEFMQYNRLLIDPCTRDTPNAWVQLGVAALLQGRESVG
jgi:hypothetical protein